MPIDSSIFATMGTRPKTFDEYSAALDARDANALAMQTGKLQYQNALQAAQDEANYREAAKGFGTDATANYNALLQRGLPKQAQAYQKAALDGQQTQADIVLKGSQSVKAQADAGKAKLETYQNKLKTGLGIFQNANSPQAVLAMLQASVQQGIYTPQEAQQQISDMPQDPAQFGAWREQQLMQGMEIGKKLDYQLKAANEIMMPNGQGGFSVNQPLVDAKKQVAKSGASSTSVKIDNKYGEGVAKEVGPMLKSSYDSAIGAQASVGTADSLINAIDSGKVISGPGASWRLKAAQVGAALGVAGKDTEEQIANTRAAIQGLAQTTLTARKQLAGQGQVSDNEGKLLERAASGNIDDMTAAEIKQIAVVNKRLAQRQVKMHEEFVGKIKKDPTTSGLATMFELPSAGDSTAAPVGGGGLAKVNSDAEYNALPSGATFVGPDGKTRRKP